MLFLSIDRVVEVQIASTRRAVDRDLTALYAFADSQSAAFAGTGFIGYSVGRYYGFAPAFSQISPDPERAAVMLRAAYGRGTARAVDLPPALLAYDTVHERFHPSFVAMIEASPFDDLFLVDRLGRVVYSLRKDAAFGADMRDPRYRDLPLAKAVRTVMARLQQEEEPARILVATEPQATEDGHAVMLARPIVRHGAVEGIAVFRLPARLIQEKLDAAEIPGLDLVLLDGTGAPVDPAAGDGGGTVVRASLADGAGWSYRMGADPGALAGGLSTGLWLLLAATVGWIGWRAAAGRRQSGPVAALEAPVPSPPESQAAPDPVAGGATPVEPPTARGEEVDEQEPSEDGQAPSAEAHSIDADEEYRRSLVDTMTLTLDYWQRCRGKGKIELAEESGLWRVYMDRSSLQTRTLDKYLLVETLPRNPRWRDVVRTAEYVLRHCPQPGPDRDALSAALSRLKQHLRRAERI